MIAGAARSAHNRRRAIQIGCVVLAAVYALVAVGSGLDRLADSSDRAIEATLLPAGLFAAGLDRASARQALIAGSPGEALSPARDAVRRDPMDATAVGLLGAAALQTGDRAYAERIFAVSARLGWRDPVAQAFLLDRALGARDYRTAGDHLDAILRQSPDLATRNLLLAPFDATPVGRAELARRLVARPAWAQPYFADTAGLAAGDPRARGDVAVILAQAAGLHDCTLVAPVVEGLLRHDHYADALRIRALHCDPSRATSDGLAVDGRFGRADLAHPPTVLDWHFTDDGAIDASFVVRARMPGRAVILDNAGSVTLAFTEQPLMLPEGSYTIRWRARDAAGAPSLAVETALTCDAQGAPWLPKTLADPGGAVLRASAIVSAACPHQRLVLGIAGGARGIAVGDIVLRPYLVAKAAADSRR